jgi:probable O-glycosylation ligase (exosortase A-associated)
MRDYLLYALIIGVLPFSLIYPFIGLLAYNWVSYMNPHRLGWKTYDFPVAAVIGATALIGFVFSRSRKSIPMSWETGFILLLWVIFSLSSMFALAPESAWAKWEQVSKILLMVLLSVILIDTEEKLRWLYLVIAVSIGFYGFKGGVFSLAHGGQYIILGPPESSIAGNNSLGAALNMTLPVLWYLARFEPNRWWKFGLRAVFAMSIIAVLFSYSRGAVLGLAAVLLLLFLRSLSWKMMAPTAIIVLVVWAAVDVRELFPEKWEDRMATTRTYQEDTSALSRLNSWEFSTKVAMARPFVGGGFKMYTDETYSRYLPGNEFPSYDAHSIYFGILGEHGFVGFSLFLGMIAMSFLTLMRLKRSADERARDYAKMLQISFVGFLISGAFVDIQYFDLFYQNVAAVAILKRIYLTAGEGNVSDDGSAANLWHYPADAEREVEGLKDARVHLS